MDRRRELHWDRLVQCCASRPGNLLTRLDEVCATRGDHIALIEDDRRISYRQLSDEAQNLASHLAKAGICAGDRVGVMLANGVDAVRTIWALLCLGGVVVPIGTRSRTAEIDLIVGDAGVRLIVHDPVFASELGAVGVLLWNVGASDWPAMLTVSAGPFVAPVQGEHDIFALLYTSGTTGKPKGVMLTHLNVIHSCLHWIDAQALTADDLTMLCVPWTHVSGLCGVVMPFLYLGATIVVLPVFKRRAALELAARERITHALMVPSMYALCLLEPDLRSFDLSHWRIGAYGGAPMPEPTIHRFAEAVPGLAMCNCYGATETASAVTIMPPGDGIARADSIGKVVYCGDVRVMDERGHEVAPGSDGELWIAGPMVAPGYWGNPEATAQSFSGGYWKSGDIGSIDDGGYVRIADRKKDMIIRGGFKIYPAEVESVLAAIAGVIEAAVVGQPDLVLGERVVAFIYSNDANLDEATVRQFCADRLSDYKVPGVVVLGSEPLPRNANGKIQKAVLRLLADALVKQVPS